VGQNHGRAARLRCRAAPVRSAGQCRPPSRPRCRRRTGPTVDGTLAPGNTVTVTGAGFAPGSQAELTVASQPQSLGFFTANGSGTVTARVTIPALDPGSHTLTLTGPLPAGGTLILTADFTVGGALPRTGANLPIRAAVTGLVIAALGALLLVSRRTRRHDWS
jgi:hypothetical protein